MGQLPLGIGRIACKSASKLVIYAAISHFAKGKDDEIMDLFILFIKRIPEKEIKVDRHWKFRCNSKTAFPGVELLFQLIDGGFQVILIEDPGILANLDQIL